MEDFFNAYGWYFYVLLPRLRNRISFLDTYGSVVTLFSSKSQYKLMQHNASKSVEQIWIA